MNVYDLIHIDELEKEEQNIYLKQFVETIRKWRETASAVAAESKKAEDRGNVRHEARRHPRRQAVAFFQ